MNHFLRVMSGFRIQYIAWIFFLISILPVNPENRQKAFPVESNLYNALEYISLESGISIPSTSRPFAAAQFYLYLKRINRSELSDAGKNAYDYMIHDLQTKSLFEDSDKLDLNITVKSNLEAYIHSNSDNPDWCYDYGERKPLLDIPFEMWINDGLYAVMNPVLKKDPYTVENAGTYSNMITDFSTVDGHFPFSSYCSFGSDHWNILFGRVTQSWGNGNSGNLILSEDFDYHDVIRFETFWRFFKFTTCYIGFDNWNDSDVSSVDDFSESFLGHRIEVRLFDRITVSISESMMLQMNAFEPRYLNPFMIYHNWFLNDRYANVNMGLELEFNPWRYINIYGQLCADQIQSNYEKNRYPAADAMPNAYGYLIGTEFSYPIWKGYLHGFIEWTKTDPWMYLIEGQPDYIVDRRVISNFLGEKKIRSLPLGYWTGPDTIVTSISAGYDVFGLFGVGIGLDYIIKGEIYQDTPFQSGPEAVALTTPTGDFPEKKTILSVKGYYTPFRFLTVGSELFYINEINADHESGKILNDFQWIPFVSFELSR